MSIFPIGDPMDHTFSPASSIFFRTSLALSAEIAEMFVPSTPRISRPSRPFLRIAAICPDTVVRTHDCFYLPETADRFDFTQYDYVADAIDTVSGKLQLAVQAKEANVPLISSMGTGNKLDPTAFEVADITKTSVCPLARVMRRELRKRGIEHLKVVYSKEPPITPAGSEPESGAHQKRQTPGSCAFVPPVAGLIMAGEIVRDLLEIKRN